MSDSNRLLALAVLNLNSRTTVALAGGSSDTPFSAIFAETPPLDRVGIGRSRTRVPGILIGQVARRPTDNYRMPP